MNKKLVLFVFVFLVSILYSQEFIDIPQLMPQDTLYYHDRVTRTFILNQEESYDNGRKWYGPVDWDFYAKCKVTSATDTATLEIYGLKRKLISGIWTLVSVDSHRVGTMPLTDSYTGKSFPIDPLFTDGFGIYDGLLGVIKRGGTDDDSLQVNNSIRLVVDPERN